MVRTFLILILTFSCSYTYAQDDLIEKVIQIRKLVTDLKTHEALTLMSQIENRCNSYNNDTIKAVFLELKGQALLDIEKYEECIPYCKDAILLFEKCNLRQYEYLDAFYIIATSYHRLKDYKNAERFYRKGLLRSVAANVSSTNQYRSALYLNLGNLYKAQGDSILASDCYNRSNQLQQKKPINVDEWNYVDWENSQWDKIMELVDAKKYEEAANMYAVFIDGIKEKKGNRNKSYLLAVYSRAILLSRYLDKVNDAIPLYSELVSLSETLSEPDENICGAFCNLALCYSRIGEYDKLNTVVTKGFSYLGKANMNGYPPHMIYRFSGNGAYWQKDYTKAIDYYELYLKPSNKREEGTNYEEIVNQLSVSYIFSNQPDKAQTILKNLLKSDKARLNKENPSLLATIYHNLGRATMLAGSKSEALKYLSTSKEMQVSLYGEVSERTAQYITECSAK